MSELEDLRAEIERLKAYRQQDYLEMCDLIADRTAAETKLVRVQDALLNNGQSVYARWGNAVKIFLEEES